MNFLIMTSLITLQKAVNEIKKSIETAIKTSGTVGKNNLIRSQKPIKLLHEVAKAELIRNKVNSECLHPPLNQSNGELSLSGFFKKKDQDICVVPKNSKEKPETLKFEGILYGQIDKFGFNFT